jgi:hypothetical protein
MICDSCGNEMVPHKDIICPSGTDMCSAPSWYCCMCANLKFVHSDKEFDHWIEQYIIFEDDDILEDKFSTISYGDLGEEILQEYSFSEEECN